MAFVLVKDHTTQYLLHQTPLSPPVMAKLNNDKKVENELLVISHTGTV